MCSDRFPVIGSSNTGRSQQGKLRRIYGNLRNKGCSSGSLEGKGLSELGDGSGIQWTRWINYEVNGDTGSPLKETQQQPTTLSPCIQYAVPSKTVKMLWGHLVLCAGAEITRKPALFGPLLSIHVVLTVPATECNGSGLSGSRSCQSLDYLRLDCPATHNHPDSRVGDKTLSGGL